MLTNNKNMVDLSEPHAIAKEMIRLDRLGASEKELLKFLRSIPWELATPYYRRFFIFNTVPIVLVEGTRKIHVVKGTWPNPKTDYEKVFQLNVFDEYVSSFLEKNGTPGGRCWEMLASKEIIISDKITYSRTCAEIIFQ